MFSRHYCAPSYVTPSYIPSYISPIRYPVGGLGSLGSYGGCGYSGYPYGVGGGAAPAGSLGILAGANVGCVTQAPPSEMVIQRAPCVVTIPGPILSTSCEPVRIGGYSACYGGYTGIEPLGNPSRYGRIGTYGLYRPYMSRRMSFGNMCRVPY